MTTSSRHGRVTAVTVDVWVRRVADVPDGRDLLDDHERATLARIAPPSTAMSYAAGHVLARRAVASVIGSTASSLRFDRTCPRCGAPHGRPVLVGPRSVELSLSRCDDWVAVAIALSALPVGLDIESIQAVRFPGFPDVALHLDERDGVEPGADGLLRRQAVSWVRREAALKALGIGLRTDPAGLRTPPSGIPTDLFGDGAAKVTVHDVALPWRDAAAAVAVAGQVRQVDVHLR
ncbi:MAG TPA: 4'-phosphopantetheinyl transferase superfamily protein [Intrasporangium sp.]|nr:4'-phosphopantetheinyl transferase superfamily protein [Intrasporangium sp.]